MSPSSLLARLAAAGVATLSALALAQPAAASPEERGCAVLDVIVLRGTAEPYPGSLNLDGFYPGTTNSDRNAPNGVWTRIKNELTNSTTPGFPSLPQVVTNGPNDYKSVVRTDISYPADLNAMTSSVSQGTNSLVGYVNSQSTRCPSKKFILLGYSQGALVVGNVTTPPNLRLPNAYSSTSTQLTATARARVVAVGLMADAGFSYYDTWADNYIYPPNWDNTPVADLNRAAYGPSLITSGYMVNTFPDLNRRMNAGNSSPGTKGLGWSIHSRNNRLGSADPSWKGKIRNYCLQGDPICQSGSGGWAEHLYYAGDSYAKQNLAVFAIQKFRGMASS